LDAWAIVALLKREPAGPRVADAIDGDEPVAASIVNLGEACYSLAQSAGEERAVSAVSDVAAQIDIVPTDWQTTILAARLKHRHPMSYADAFCVATAQQLDASLWTGDPEIIRLREIVDVIDLRSTA
jgi:predicted nucleic acid-binding protein